MRRLFRRLARRRLCQRLCQAKGSFKTPRRSPHVLAFSLKSNMSLSGANADHRIPCTPADQKNTSLSVRYLSGSMLLQVYADLKESTQKKHAMRCSSSGSDGVVVTGMDDETAQASRFGDQYALKK